jgi:hypothetical protein
MMMSFAKAKGSPNCDFRRTSVNKVYSWTINSIGTRPIIATSTFQKSPDLSSRSFQLIRKRLAALLLKLIIGYNAELSGGADLWLSSGLAHLLLKYEGGC